MSKIIKLTNEQLQECRKEFDTALSSMKLADGKISFIKTITSLKEKATLYFDPIAWRKMQTLIKEFDKEVAWHGVAYRGTNKVAHEYLISDILVYPQVVTGATVNTDQEKYEMWLMQHDDDVFNNIRMQGHSHVNMSVTPSSVDETHQSKILEQLEDDMFYIFLVWNKRGDKNIKIYDLEKNILFETADIDVMILDDGSGINEFLAEAKKMVEDKPVTPAYNNGYNYSRSSYGGYNSDYNKSSTKETKSAQSKNNVVPIDDAKKTETKSTSNDKYGKNGKRKGKRKKNNVITPKNAYNNSQTTMFDDDYDPLYDKKDSPWW